LVGTHAFAGDVNCEFVSNGTYKATSCTAEGRKVRDAEMRARYWGQFLRSTSSPRSFSIFADWYVDGGVVLKVAALGSRYRRRQSCEYRAGFRPSLMPCAASHMRVSSLPPISSTPHPVALHVPTNIILRMLIYMNLYEVFMQFV
jgi:hypothetical protein